MSKVIPPKEAGDGPFFLYDERELHANVGRMRDAWKRVNSARFSVFYSVKANPNPHVLRALVPIVEGFDVSSLEELEMVVRLGVVPGRITVSGPAKNRAFLERAVQLRVHSIHVDSAEELRELRSLAPGTWVPRLTLRVADPALPTAKLGFAGDALEAVLSGERGTIAGLHMYLGRESFEAARVLGQLGALASLRARHAAAFTAGFELFVGPGLPSWTALDPGLDPFLGKAKAFPFPVNVEAGRAIAGTAGAYGAEVLSVKEGPGARPCVIIAGGVHHLGSSLISPSFGTKGLTCEAWRGGNPLNEATRPCSIYGSLCLANDIVHPHADLPAGLARGDWLLFRPCGAYGITAAASQFIGLPRPKELMIGMNGALRDVSPLWEAYHRSFGS